MISTQSNYSFKRGEASLQVGFLVKMDHQNWESSRMEDWKIGVQIEEVLKPKMERIGSAENKDAENWIPQIFLQKLMDLWAG